MESQQFAVVRNGAADIASFAETPRQPSQRHRVTGAECERQKEKLSRELHGAGAHRPISDPANAGRREIDRPPHCNNRFRFEDTHENGVRCYKTKAVPSNRGTQELTSRL